MNKWLFVVISAMTLAAIVSNFYTFYVRKNYNFSIEAPCDAANQACFIRDCNDGDCPPNELTAYRVFDIKAADFDQCTDDSCLAQCTSGAIMCEEVMCGESEDDICSNS